MGTRENGISFARSLRSLAVIAALALALFAAPTAEAAGCSRIAAPGGSDSAPGTVTQPFATAQKLADSLAPGETGCLRAGTYAEDVTITSGGTAGAPMTLTSYPGERATVRGAFWITRSAPFVTVASLDLDGRNAPNYPSPEVNATDARFVDNDVTNHNTSICFNLGGTTDGRADRALIERNRIHNCGELPRTNLDHGIYVEHATDARIVDNTIFDNADRGVQLYPDAFRTYVARNVIDGNGEGVLIGGGSEDYGAQASSENVIEHNVITNSTHSFNVMPFWGSPVVGKNNIVRENCIWGGARDGENHGLNAGTGVTASSNTFADPGYVDRAAKDFRLRSDSGCNAAFGSGTPAARSVPSFSIALDSKRPSVRPGGRLSLLGRITGAARVSKVLLKIRRGHRWQRVTATHAGSDGRFASSPRLRGKRGHRTRAPHRLALKHVRLSGHTRVLRVRAYVAGAGHSRTLTIRVRR
jgi:hypothetical protein